MALSFKLIGHIFDYQVLNTFDLLTTTISGLECVAGQNSPSSVNYRVETCLPKRENASLEVALSIIKESGRSETIRRVPFRKEDTLAFNRALYAHYSLVREVMKGSLPDDIDIARYFEQYKE